jgi:hypothetical protein
MNAIWILERTPKTAITECVAFATSGPAFTGGSDPPSWLEQGEQAGRQMQSIPPYEKTETGLRDIARAFDFPVGHR